MGLGAIQDLHIMMMMMMMMITTPGRGGVGGGGGRGDGSDEICTTSRGGGGLGWESIDGGQLCPVFHFPTAPLFRRRGNH